MFDFITIGGATRDMFFKIKEADKKKAKKALEKDQLFLPYGEKLIAEETYYTYGGGAANAATCLARLGAKVGAMCNIGSEGTGSLIKKTLIKEGINTSLVTRDERHHTGLSIFMVGKDNEHTGILERGANNFLVFRPRRMHRTRWFYVSSLTGDSATILPRLFSYAVKNNIKIAFNPGSQQLNEDLEQLLKFIPQTEVLSLNMEEAECLVSNRRRLKNKRAVMLAVGALGARITIITDGENGLHAISDGKIYSQPAVSTEVVDTTGAGDCAGATFVYSVAKGHDLRHSLKIASINSSSVVSFMGAQQGLMTYHEIKESL
jgi:sugar/nucleoside kinase (ribokinase family)